MAQEMTMIAEIKIPPILKNNPRIPTAEEIEQIYRKAWQ